MRLYWPDPNPPGKPKACTECGTKVDGTETKGWWLEKENHHDHNTYHLFCLQCCVRKMNEWPNHADVSDAEAVERRLYGGKSSSNRSRANGGDRSDGSSLSEIDERGSRRFR